MNACMIYSNAEWAGSEQQRWGGNYYGMEFQPQQQWDATDQWDSCHQQWAAEAQMHQVQQSWTQAPWQLASIPSTGRPQGCQMLNLDQFSDASDSEDEDAKPSKKECGASSPEHLARSASVAEPAAEPSPIGGPLPQEESELKLTASQSVLTTTPTEVDAAWDISSDHSAAGGEGDSSETGEALSSAGEPEPEETEQPEPPRDVPAIAVHELVRLRAGVQSGSGPLPGKRYLPGRLVAAEPPAGGWGAELVQRATQAASRSSARRKSTAASRLRKPVAKPRQTTTSEGLKVTGTSWAAQQRARRSELSEMDSAEVERKLKSILNKLTLTNFDSLCQQLLECGVWAASHLELLIGELFEKATTQHHFIDMYADLCVVLHDHFGASPPAGTDERFSFKRLLLNACQVSFEKHLAPPEGLDSLSAEDRTEAEVRYKTKMLGNIRFVGALLVRQILASKVLLAIIAELLSNPTREALEALAALLTVVGPAFDVDEWAHRSKLDAVFAEMAAIAARPGCEPRSRCLLKDVLDMRKQGWRDRRPKQREAPMAQRGDAAPKGQCATIGRRTSAAGLQAPRAALAVKPPAEGSSAAFRAELAKMLSEIRNSEDASEAALRIVQQLPPPAGEQPEEFNHMLTQICQESTGRCRRAAFWAAAGVFLEGRWRPAAARQGLQKFVDGTEDLQYDVPTLPGIMREEMLAALQPLARRGLLEESALQALA